MKYFLLLPLSLLLSSCFHVYFDQPQPKDGILLTEVPQELWGKWSEDTQPSNNFVQIHAQGMTTSSGDTDSFTDDGEIHIEHSYLSDSVKLYKVNEYYVVNLLGKEANGRWEMVIIDVEENGDLSWYYPYTTPYAGKGHGLKIDYVEKGVLRYNEAIGDTVSETIRGNSFKLKDGETMEAVYYKGQMRASEIAKIIRPENTMWTYTKKGMIIPGKAFND